MHSDLFYQKNLVNTRFSNRKKASFEAFCGVILPVSAPTVPVVGSVPARPAAAGVSPSMGVIIIGETGLER